MKPKLLIVGLGPGREGLISFETWQILHNTQSDGRTLLLRTKQHPSVSLLNKSEIPFESYDSFYEKYQDFESVYAAICNDCIARLSSGQNLVYAVPGSPFVAEHTVELLCEQAKTAGYEAEVLPGMSFLEVLYTRLGLDPNRGLTVLDAHSVIEAPVLMPTVTVITQVYSKLLASDLKLALMELLKDDEEVTLIHHLSLPDEQIITLPLYELDRCELIDHLTSLIIKKQPDLVTLDTVKPLTDVMATLREPGGCPWDREQNHASLRKYLIEEVYEVIEAIDLNSPDMLREELGDLLLQIVFHARIAEEKGLFAMNDVVKEVTDKMIHRHPHVFGHIEADTPEQVLVNWEALKASEKKGQRKNVLDGVPPGLPALMKAQKIQSKAAKVGFDWHNLEPVWDKLFEEIDELKEAMAEGNKKNIESELGDCFFVLVNLARFLKLDAELALSETNKKFCRRFAFVEQSVKQSGKPWSDFTVPQLDEFWEMAKKHEIPSFMQKE